MTQAARVLLYLKQNGSITPWQAIMELHITRLAAVINKLRSHGHNIITTIKTNKGTRWAEYTIKEPTATAIAVDSKGGDLSKNSTSEDTTNM